MVKVIKNQPKSHTGRSPFEKNTLSGNSVVNELMWILKINFFVKD